MPKIIDNPREIILIHAKDIIVNEGFNKLTMREVSKKSGIAVGTIYNYFPTKMDLTIQLMENYWYDYLDEVNEIDKTEQDFYLKLFKLYKRLDNFLETFMEVWVKNANSGYTEDSLNRKKHFQEKLTKKFEEILLKAQNNGDIHLVLEPKATAKFLMLNFIMMAQMKEFEYTDFEKILRKIFK
ncbi:MAG: TetR/AcrR family transcriptional regulator [Bacillota bacterium]|nr:TetR/AcrR family transcriptional regulator [Bacillota bacterium]